jgi:transposase
MPLSQPPGEAQVDFGQAVTRIGGRLTKVVFFVMSLVHSDAMFVMAFPRECTEAFLEAHVRAFQFFGFVLRRISYDNTKVAVTQITGSSCDGRSSWARRPSASKPHKSLR